MSQSLISQLLKRAIDSLVVMTKACDIPEAEVHDAVAKSYAEITLPESGDEHDDAPAFSIPHRYVLGHMLTIWRNHPDFVDDSGSPAPLPLEGPLFSMEALFERAKAASTGDLTNIDAFSAAETLVSHHSAAIDDKDRYYPTAYGIRFLGDRNERGMANLSYFGEIGGTTAYNVLAPPGEGRLLAVARARRLPSELLSVLRAKVTSAAWSFLSSIDAQMESINTGSTGSDDSRDVGIAIVFIDEPHEDKH